MLDLAWNARVGADVVTRIDLCSQSLKSGANKNFGDIQRKIKMTEKKLSKAQTCVPDTNMICMCKELTEELD